MKTYVYAELLYLKKGQKCVTTFIRGLLPMENIDANIKSFCVKKNLIISLIM